MKKFEPPPFLKISKTQPSLPSFIKGGSNDEVRLKAQKLWIQSKFIPFEEIYISRSTNPRKVFYRLNFFM